MKIKARLNKFHRVNPNGVLCDATSLDKLREGGVVDVPEEVGNELLKMGFVEQAKTKTKKEAK
tara:strand:+ start:3623 stop:3811 length:189 start_codon:yes stop_codon:yes gene_type:complete